MSNETPTQPKRITYMKIDKNDVPKLVAVQANEKNLFNKCDMCVFELLEFRNCEHVKCRCYERPDGHNVIFVIEEKKGMI